MAEPAPAAESTLVVVDPAGHRARLPVVHLPFRIGRAVNNHLVLRDGRVSRFHAQLSRADGQIVVEDLGSRHGVWVNGQRIAKSHPLHGGERIEFGVPDGYQVHFTQSRDELHKLLDQPPVAETSQAASPNLEKLRAVLELGRSLQSSFSVDDVLNAVVDAAIAVTGADRGFLLLFDHRHELQVRSARSGGRRDLDPSELRIPRILIQHALECREDLFSMSFDPDALASLSPESTIAVLELRSTVFLPLVRLNVAQRETAQQRQTAQLSRASCPSAGVLYLDSRIMAGDLARGNRELLQTLAIEASTVLENARLLDEERVRQRIEEELDVARRIQQMLLPRRLPEQGWFVAYGSSEPSHQVGGDYFDAMPIASDAWSVVIADVSGKGVSSALLASFLQGAFLSATCTRDIPSVLVRLNGFLVEREAYSKYATLFYATLDASGLLTYANAGHCPPLVVRAPDRVEKLYATSMPVGLTHNAEFRLASCRLTPGDRIVLYTDGLTEARNVAGEFFGRKRLIDAVQSVPGLGCRELHDTIRASIATFTEDAEQGDDLTLVVLGYGES